MEGIFYEKRLKYLGTIIVTFCLVSLLMHITSFALELLSGKEKYTEFMNTPNETNCLEITNNNGLTHKKAIDIIKKYKAKNAQAVQESPVET